MLDQIVSFYTIQLQYNHSLMRIKGTTITKIVKRLVELESRG